MEPTSIFSIALSVAAFLEFGAQLAPQAFQIRGSTEVRAETVRRLNEHNEEARRLALQAQQKIEAVETKYPKDLEPAFFGPLATGSTEIETQLTTALENLRAKTTGNFLTRLGRQDQVSIQDLWSEDDGEVWRNKVGLTHDWLLVTVLRRLWLVILPGHHALVKAGM